MYVCFNFRAFLATSVFIFVSFGLALLLHARFMFQKGLNKKTIRATMEGFVGGAALILFLPGIVRSRVSDPGTVFFNIFQTC